MPTTIPPLIQQSICEIINRSHTGDDNFFVDGNAAAKNIWQYLLSEKLIVVEVKVENY